CAGQACQRAACGSGGTPRCRAWSTTARTVGRPSAGTGGRPCSARRSATGCGRRTAPTPPSPPDAGRGLPARASPWCDPSPSPLFACRGPAGGEVVEGDAGVGEPREVDLLCASDQVFDVGGDVPDVDVHAGHDPPVGGPERDEFALGEVATY